MVKIPETYNIGDPTELTLESLAEVLEDMYRTLAIAVNQKPHIYTRDVTGTPTLGNASDSFVSVGDINIKTDTGVVEIATTHPTATTVTWTTI